MILAVGPALASAQSGWHQLIDEARAREVAAESLERLAEVEERWRERLRTATDTPEAALFGYDPPGLAVQLAWLYAWWYQRDGQEADAQQAWSLLERTLAYRDEVPHGHFDHRPEYGPSLPAVPNFFRLAEFADAYRWIRDRVASPEQRPRVESAIAGSAEFVFAFPEWGPHNRAILRAEGLLACARALPEERRAPRWRALARVLAQDSLNGWEVEDASHYQPIWWLATMRYAEAAGETPVPHNACLRSTLDLFAQLVTPLGTVADYGDAWWNSNAWLVYECLMWGATRFQRGDLLVPGAELLDCIERQGGRGGLARVLCWARLHGRADPAMHPAPFERRQGFVPDERAFKKVLFRSGEGELSSYFLLNYQDEGDFGRRTRDYLRETLAVEQEKMHHGHSDENAVILWIDEGSLLLHEAGYRPALPSGPHGAYRGDLFHHGLMQRRGRPASGQSLFDFALDSGDYRPAHTEAIDFVTFEQAAYSRTRRSSDTDGTVHDRTVVSLPDRHLFVVVDHVRIEMGGARTFAPLWAVGEILEQGNERIRGRTLHHAGRTFPDRRQLVAILPRVGDDTAELVTFSLDRHRAQQTVFTVPRSVDSAKGDFVTLVTVLCSVPSALPTERAVPEVRGEVLEEGAVLGLELRFADESIVLCVRGDLGHGLRSDGLRPLTDASARIYSLFAVRSDADLVVVRQARDRSSGWWAAVGPTELSLAGTPRFEARSSRFFQTDGTAGHVGRARWRWWQESWPDPH